MAKELYVRDTHTIKELKVKSEEALTRKAEAKQQKKEGKHKTNRAAAETRLELLSWAARRATCPTVCCAIICLI